MPIDLILKRRLEIIIIFAVLFSCVMIKVFFFPTYEATTTIMIDVKKGPTSLEAERMDLRENIGYIRIHSELLKSNAVLRKVVEELKLYEDLPNWDKQAAANISDAKKEKYVRAAMELLRKKYLTIESPPFTNLIDVKVKYKNPELAAKIANSLVDNYLKWDVSLIHREVDNIIDYLSREVPAVREKLLDSEMILQKFREENKVISIPDEVRSYFEVIPQELRYYYQLLKDKEIKLFELEVELTRLEELYAEESPQIIYMKKRINELRKDANKQKEKTKFTTSDYLTRLKDIPAKEIMFARLTREVKINETLYTFLLQEQEKARLIKAKQTTENIMVVSPALTPIRPKGRLTNLFLGMIISLIFAFGLPLLFEAKRKFIRK